MLLFGWFWFDLSFSVRPPVDKTQQRLAELEQSEETVAKETLQLTQKVSTFFPLVFSFSFSSLFWFLLLLLFNHSKQEYEKRIDQLHQELIQSWNSEDRVKSLKIAIQVLLLFLYYYHYIISSICPSSIPPPHVVGYLLLSSSSYLLLYI